MPATARARRPSPVDRGEHVLDFLRQLWAVDHALQRRSKQMLRERGVTGPQRLALRLLLLEPGISAGELAGAMHVHPSTLTGVLERLERRRLVRRRARPGDLRSVELHATPAGAAIVRETRGTVEDAVRRSLARHTQRELDVARDVLRELEQELLGE
ncbi:MAG: MarR family transcriptional regulator [Planctomycetota bacterium]|nr:MAG: MarR family transcriptional regulator [Planctomycetota bacterium]